MRVFIVTLKLQDCPSTKKDPGKLLFSLLEGERTSRGEMLSDIWCTGLVGSSLDSLRVLRVEAGVRAHLWVWCLLLFC